MPLAKMNSTQIPIPQANTLVTVAAPQPRLKFYDKNGNTLPALSDQEVQESLRIQVRDLSVHFTDKTRLANLDEMQLMRSVIETYYSLRLGKAHFKSEESLPNFQAQLKGLYKFYERTLREPMTFKNFTFLLTFSFLLTAMQGFGPANVNISTGVREGLTLLLSSVEPEFVSRACQLFLPPTQLSSLFLRTMAHEFVILEEIATEDANVKPSVRMMADILKIKYGKFFTVDFSEELFSTYNTYDYEQCADMLWNNATGADDTVLLSFGRSFLIKMINLQWGLIREAKVFAPDRSSNLLLVDGGKSDYFAYVASMYCRLFSLLEALDRLFVINSMNGPILNLSADTMSLVYQDMNEYLECLATALMDSYTVELQHEITSVDYKSRINLIRSAKLALLLGTFGLALLKKILIGPLSRFNVPSISPIVERFVGNCDYSFVLPMSTLLPPHFNLSVSMSERALYESYQFLMSIDDRVKRYLNGGVVDPETEPTNMLTMSLSLMGAFFVALICGLFTFDNFRSSL